MGFEAFAPASELICAGTYHTRHKLGPNEREKGNVKTTAAATRAGHYGVGFDKELIECAESDSELESTKWAAARRVDEKA